MKKVLYLVLAGVLCSALVFTACSSDSSEQTEEASETEAVETEVTQEDIEENIIGNWVLADIDGKPALTNEKFVFALETAAKGYVSVSLNAPPDVAAPWLERIDCDVTIDGSKITYTDHPDEKTISVVEYDVTSITAKEFTANQTVTYTIDGDEGYSREDSVRFTKINYDYSKDIIGTWEGHCTSDGSTFDDGKNHRWEYQDDGTYTYYEKEGSEWKPSDNTTNEYFVNGNLLCTRWVDSDGEHREWWEIAIDGDTMNWTALREDEDGSTYTTTFEMTRVEE